MKQLLKNINPFQLGIVVDDLDSAVKNHSDIFNIKRWYRPVFTSVTHLYKGIERDLELDIAIGFSGGSQIELIEVKRGEDNAYVEFFMANQLIHTGVTVRQFDTKVNDMHEMGFELIFSGTLKTARANTVRVAFFDTRAALGYVIELIESTALGINVGMPEWAFRAGIPTGDITLYQPKT